MGSDIEELRCVIDDLTRQVREVRADRDAFVAEWASRFGFLAEPSCPRDSFESIDRVACLLGRAPDPWPQVGARVVRRKHPEWGAGTIDRTQDGPLPWIVVWDDGGVTGMRADEIVRLRHDPSHQTCDPTPATPCHQDPAHETLWCAVHDTPPDWIECKGAKCPDGGMFDADASDKALRDHIERESAIAREVEAMHATPPPAPPLTVARALALPEVRSGEKWVEVDADKLWRRQYRFDPHRHLAKLMCRGGTHDYIQGLPWDQIPLASDDLFAECRLVEPAKEQTP